MPKREFVMLAHDYDAKKHYVGGSYLSEKIDGIRCLWDGGVSRGVHKPEVPWANNDKDERYEETPVATGLWSRYGNIIHAPDWFLDTLPPVPLDGEMYAEGVPRQTLISWIKTIVPVDANWQKVTYHVFDTPAAVWFAGDGQINAGNNFKKMVKGGMIFWNSQAEKLGITTRNATARFPNNQNYLESLELQHPILLHPQHKLPLKESDARTQANIFLQDVLAKGGEGVIFRERASCWKPERLVWLLKLKPRKDSEAEVIGYKWGNAGKEDRLLGRMGSLTLRWNNPLGQTVEFDMNAGTMAERVMCAKASGELESVESRYREARITGCSNPGTVVDEEYENPEFPMGSQVTFSFRTLTKDGKPEEAQLLRAADGV